MKKLNDNIFLLKYENDYGLDELLSKGGVKSVKDLILFVQNRFSLPENAIEINEGEFACTAFNCFNDKGEQLLARNFDYKAAPCVVVWTSPENGYKSIAVTDTNVLLYGEKHQNLSDTENRNRLLAAPYTCMDGINEKGLAVAVLEIKTKATNQSTGKTDVTTTVLIRAILDKCATVDEAVDFIRSVDVHDSLFCCYHYQITDESGKSVIVEFVDNELRLIYPENRVQSLTNFFLSFDGDNKKGFGYTRKKIVDKILCETNGNLNEDKAMNMLEKCQLNFMHRRGYPVTTLWSEVFNCSEKSMTICANTEYDKQYKFDVFSTKQK
ncbi:MAG: linear amide C-N hydrolase [Ruminococcus sp.]|nr:linear amide C-N hydrolase [Candidatus Copronaster equi]